MNALCDDSAHYQDGIRGMARPEQLARNNLNRARGAAGWRSWDMRRTSLLLCMLAALAVMGCTAEQLYATGRSWQHTECAKVVDPEQRDRCYEDANQPYGTYKRESDALKAAK
jgi:hypothetical protein